MENKTNIESKIEAAVSEQLTERNKLSSALANLKARQVKIESDLGAISEKRSAIVLKKLDIVGAGGTSGDEDRLIEGFNLKEKAGREELTAIKNSIPGRQVNLQSAEDALKRAAFSTIEKHRPDAEINKLAEALKSAVDAWDISWNEQLQKYDIKVAGQDHFASFDASFVPWISNDMIKWFNKWVPKNLRPAPLPKSTEQSQPEKPKAPPEKPKAKTLDEVQADARKSGRSKTNKDKKFSGQAIAGSEYNSLT